MKMKKMIILTLTGALALSGVACTAEAVSEEVQESTLVEVIVTEDAEDTNEEISSNDMFTERDLEQEADLSDASFITLESDTDYLIENEGVYVITGHVTDSTIKIDVDDESKVQLVLDNVTIENESSPAVYILSGDKVFISSTDSENLLAVTGNFVADGETNLDAVIFSKSDLVLNGLGSIDVLSINGNGVTSKDDLKITGGEITVTAKLDGFEANDSIRIYDGTITVDSGKDAFHSENDEDLEKGYIYIQGGTLNITAVDDAIRANSIIQIDGGTINIETCTEGIEATQVIINDGNIDIYSTDDGINATRKSDYDVMIEINGGSINVDMASGDTDAFDSNGDLYINGGYITATGGSIFDADGTSELNGGEVIANGEVQTEIVSQMMGGKNKKR